METTSHLITSLLWFLKKSPKSLEKLQSEIDDIIKSENDITSENLSQLKYLDACIKEALRIIPPAQNISIRGSVKDTTLGDIKVKKGTLISILIPSLLAGKGLTNEKKFQPERWLNGEMDKINFLYIIPFSAGPRNCIG